MATVAPTHRSAPPPSSSAASKRSSGAFKGIDPLSQTQYWPQIKHERAMHAAQVDGLKARIDELEAAHRALRERYKRLKTRSDVARVRRVLRDLLTTAAPGEEETEPPVLDRALVRAAVEEALGALGS